MKNRLTKFFTVFLAVVLCIGMAPATGSTAYAASRWGGSSISSWWNSWFGGSNKSDAPTKEEEEQPTDPDAGGKLNLSKSISKNDDGTYTINLEAYATGKVDVSTTESYKPTDIVLVLDQSASMLDGFSTSSTVTYEKISRKTNCKLNHTDNLYVKDTDGEYYSVNVEYKWDLNQTYVYTYNGKTVEGKGILNKGPKLDFYVQKTQTTTESKEVALERAVTQFVNQIQATAKDHNVNYRIAIVGYGSYKGDYNRVDYKNTEILTTKDVVNYKNAKDIDYKNALVDVNVDGQLNQRVQNAIKNIIVEEDTATSADLGMEMAQKVLKNNQSTAEDRNKVVVMFTDGEPNHSNGFSTNVANTTIGTSKTIKDTYKANVFTVGILQGANPDDTTSDINKYMNYVSSNYPNAVSLTEGKTGSNQGYYMNAKNASQLNSIFKTISSSIETPSTSVTLNGQSVLKDVISDNFTLPKNVKTSDIKVYTAPFAGKNGGEYTWGEKQPFNATVSIDGNTVNVNGFDYSSNYAVTTSKGNQGNKLIVQIPVNIVRTFGGNNIPSNENTSGIYDKGTMVKAFEVPKVDAPVDYKVAGTETWINAGEEVSLADLVGTAADGAFEYKADGKKNRFVDLIYTIKDENGNVVGTYTIKAGKTASDAVGTTGPLDVDTTYTIECTVRPITTGTTKETTVPSAISHVYIYGEAKAFVIDFGKPVTYEAKDVFSKNELRDTSKISIKESPENPYGTLTLDNTDKSITYKLNKFMDGIDTYVFNVGCKSATKKVSMIPASSIYYEDNFTDEHGNFLIQYGEGWKEKGKDSVSGINGDGNLGYDSNYNTGTSELVYSAGSIHYVPKSKNITRATFTFKGQGIDLYSYTSGSTGRVTISITDENDKEVFYKTISTKYNSGEAYQVPVVTFMGEKTQNYEVKIIVPKNTEFYLDALRIYNSVNVNKEQIGGVDVDNESSAKFVSIREQSLLSNNADLFTVDGDVFIDAYLKKNAKVVAIPTEMTEYTTYGRKTEVVVAPGSSVTLTLNNASKYSKVQLGARIDAAIPSVIDGVDSSKVNTNGKVLVNSEEINIKSSTDMYYTVKVVDGKLVITNNTNKLLALTKLKLVEK